jgi:cysteine desulfurase/selenocysteine lyase
VTDTALDPTKLRADFPILETVVHGDKPLVYLDNAATTQRPRQVTQAMVEMDERFYGNVHRGIHWLSDQSTDRIENARRKVRSFLNARRDHEVIFTAGCTAAINMVARTWGDANVGEDDEIIVTEMEHHSNLVPWHQLAQRTGCRIRAIPITDDGLLVLDRLDELLSERTKLVAVCAVSNVLGTTNPAREIVRRAHDAGAVVLLDAAQSVPHLPTDVQSLDVDFLALSGHKMLGPSGIGALYGKERLLEAMPPFLGGGGMIRPGTDTVRIAGFEPGPLPDKFEAGTPPIVPAVGLAVAIDYLTEIGLERIHAHEEALTTRAHEILCSEGDVRILGPTPDKKGGLVSFVIEGIQANDLAQVLDQQGIAVRAGHHCTMPLHNRLGVSASCRASFYLYNTLAEVERLGEALDRARDLFLRRKKRLRRRRTED